MDFPGFPPDQQHVTGRMLPPPPPPAKRVAAFDLKGTMAPLTVLRLRSSDIQLVDRQLRVKISQLPHMFLHAPVLIDLGALEEASPLTVIQVVAILKACKLVPVAATNVPEAMRATIANEGLGILHVRPVSGARPFPRRRDRRDPGPRPDAGTRTDPGGRAEARSGCGPAVRRRRRGCTWRRRSLRPRPGHQAAPVRGPVVVRQPVRGGQVIYAQNNDLVVLAPVNAGAQVIADGHVHIYAKLRGRAVAGAKGLAGARVFVQKLEAELVAVSDAYMSAEEIPHALRGKSAQIWLEDGQCKAAPL